MKALTNQRGLEAQCGAQWSGLVEQIQCYPWIASRATTAWDLLERLDIPAKQCIGGSLECSYRKQVVIEPGSTGHHREILWLVPYPLWIQ